MNAHLIVPIWIGLLALSGGNASCFQEEWQGGLIVRRVKKRYAFWAILPLILFAGYRSAGELDTPAYINMFWRAPDSLFDAVGYALDAHKDKGFSFLTVLARAVFGSNYRPFFLLLAAVQGICVTRFFRKYSESYLFSLFLFVASTDYMSWMFNGIRQFLAVSVALCATPYILRKQYKPFILLTLLASTFHQSALLMLPFAIISQGEALNKRTILFILGIIAASAFIGRMTGMMNEALQSTQYKNVVSDYTQFNDDGTNPLRVLVYSIPAILAFFSRNVIRRTPDPLVHFCTNMSILSAGLYVFSMFTSGIFIGRLPIYCSLYSYILLPWQLNHCFGSANRKPLFAVAVAGYIGFYFAVMRYQFHIL